MRPSTPVSIAAGVGESLLCRIAPGARRQSSALDRTEHRPWPPPAGPWLMGQTWEDLLFAHWRVPLAELRAVVPPEVQIDTFEGDAWLGVTPFVVRNLRLRGTPPPPVVSSFPELNVRTYVIFKGRPGIWFLSLDAHSAAAVWGARRSYRLPYFRATMHAAPRERWVHYRSVRTSRDGPPAEFQGRYRPIGERFEARPESLEYFLSERYCLYTLDDHRRVQRGEIHHRPWPLQEATGAIARNTMTAPYGIQLRGPPLLHFAARQDVVIWPLAPAG